MSVSTSPTPKFIDLFESRLHSLLEGTPAEQRGSKLLLEASRHLATAGAAKRMRPLLVDHFGEAVDLPSGVRLAIATAAELIHTASLLHDDVVDNGTERRGRPTVNAQWYNSVAVLGGDLLLCFSLEQLSELPRPVTATAVELVAEMTRAAMEEVQVRRARRWALDDWKRVAHGKTGALLGWCGTAPALCVDQPVLAKRFAQCGHHLGLAFQLTDDLCELLGLQRGKDAYADLRNANPSYPVALARSNSPHIRSALDEMWDQGLASDAQLQQMAARIIDSGAANMTLERIEDHIDNALQALGDFAERPGGAHIAQWANQLRQMASEATEEL